jgi:hypothetical protein
MKVMDVNTVSTFYEVHLIVFATRNGFDELKFVFSVIFLPLHAFMEWKGIKIMGYG